MSIEQSPSTSEATSPKEPDSRFTSDWVTWHAPTWTQLFGNLASSPCNLLEIGCHEARSTLWFLDNIVKHPHSKLTTIDPWYSNWEGAAKRWMRAMTNLSEHPNWGAVNIIRERSDTALARLLLQRESFDVAYVDGSHFANDVLLDGVLAGRLLKPGGILVFDDYLWRDAAKNNGPKEGVDAFIMAHQQSFQVVNSGYQMALKKIR